MVPTVVYPPKCCKTIATVEAFVDKHRQQPVDCLLNLGGPEGLLPVLLRCQADEQHHRDQAATLGGDLSNRLIRAW